MLFRSKTKDIHRFQNSKIFTGSRYIYMYMLILHCGEMKSCRTKKQKATCHIKICFTPWVNNVFEV